MSQNYCDRCGRPIKDPNAKYGWRCAEIVAAGGSLTVDLSAILTMLEKYADFSFDAQRDLFEVFGIFNKMLTFASSPYLLQAEEDYVEKGAGLAYAMFSNYESLNTDEKKSAVSHFISEMQMADDTLPLPITKPSFSERINMELQNYYATKNNPDTNDTVEDSIDAFFGNIPLYNYLNAIFAPTERERKRNLIRGIESSLRAIENLPYTSSMMGDISIVHPYPAVVPEPYPPAADSARNGKTEWNSWQNYEKITANGQQYAKVGNRLYSKHAVERMQPSGKRYTVGDAIKQVGGVEGRSVSPQFVEDVINSTIPTIQVNGNLSYVSGTIEVITNQQGYVVTIITR